MNFNLKNFPQGGDDKPHKQYVAEMAMWAVNFEKELREILENGKGLVALNDDDTTKDVLIGVKEILGEK